MLEQDRLLKNKQISQTKRQTIDRHSLMEVKTFDVKIQESRLSKEQKEALTLVFLEQKWYKNFVLNWAEQSSENRVARFNTKQTEIAKKDKDMNDIPVKIRYLTAQSRQCLISRMCSNIKTLHSLKSKKLQKCGKLKYSKEERIIDLKQYGVSHKILSSKRVKIAGMPKTFVVNGLKQFLSISGIEIANARLLHRATGYYLQFVCYIPKSETAKEKIDEVIGIDFGCSTSFTTSKGEKISATIPESDRLKRCQKNLARKVKGSKNWNRELRKVKKEYQRINNRKNDSANKIVCYFSQYRTVVIQDEQLQKWHKNGHGKAVQHSVLGRVKAKLKLKSNTVVLDKYLPTTKFCTECGLWHDELKVWDRTFSCSCGVKMDRDIHAAQNMVWFFENYVGVGHAKVKRVEMESILIKIISDSNKQTLSVKHEAHTL